MQNQPGVYEEWDLAQYFVAEVKPVENQNAIDIELRLEGLPEDRRGSFGGMLQKAQSLDELADRMGIDKEGLRETTAKMAEYAGRNGRRVRPLARGGEVDRVFEARLPELRGAPGLDAHRVTADAHSVLPPRCDDRREPRLGVAPRRADCAGRAGDGV